MLGWLKQLVCERVLVVHSGSYADQFSGHAECLCLVDCRVSGQIKYGMGNHRANGKRAYICRQAMVPEKGAARRRWAGLNTVNGVGAVSDGQCRANSPDVYMLLTIGDIRLLEGIADQSVRESLLAKS